MANKLLGKSKTTNITAILNLLCYATMPRQNVFCQLLVDYRRIPCLVKKPIL